MLLATVAAAMMVPSIAAADPGGKGKGQGNAAAHSGHGSKASGPARAHDKDRDARHPTAVEAKSGKSRRVVNNVRADNVFDRNDEAAIRSYYRNSAACPPGLAAKNNGCLPPGQARKTYRVGNVIPADRALAPLPSDLLGRLPLVPSGYSYGRYDGDVYLVENRTRRIVDNILLNLLR
ncbi:MAG: DUF1236 domain-containing protein [Sphingomonadaceae bacterium]|nr:DUF1236 domain-containing protein [Sphingomonadaceae bacterium]